ncbi:BLUF domain-containing protein [Hymenobacter cellulosilyticus]|uniref:BLUF domain-containing protein n=1 Tax=Hymenobacter cellulosilyticus TaxID=2932248 RepID=A0A8T9Q4C1_9BACT|nr:BLUF domain-containing protein [Hymenobacter cellulosilyticus]UOQ70329.1 BLUF domain-containing protein [Hymenobacter cellulosilyticus]
MTADLHHLVYQSNVTAPLSEAELEALLTHSRAWNHSHGLTGVLLYCDSHVLQVLEGPQHEVEYIFGRIEQDLRHYDVTKLADGPIPQRCFAQWSMGFKAVHPEDFAYLTGYLNLATPSYPNSLIKTNTEAASLQELLVSFVTDHKIRY